MEVKQYIGKYGKIEIIDKDNKFAFWCNGNDVIGGRFKVRDKRIL